MKPSIAKLVYLVALLSPLYAQARLIDNGSGLIYDDVKNLTWIKDMNLASTEKFGVTGDGMNMYAEYGQVGVMDWSTAQTWIQAMNQAQYKGFADWRLPTSDEQPGYNQSGSELGYMYYINLNNSAPDPVCGSSCQPMSNLVPFTNVPPLYHSYWTSADFFPSPDTGAWYFDFAYGYQYAVNKSEGQYAWAVRNGESTNVPEPETLAVFGLGLLCLIAAKRRNLRSFQRA